MKTEIHITALRGVRKYSNGRLQQFHGECLRRLISKLCAASAEIETFTDGETESLTLSQFSVNHGPMKRLRYSLFENHLQKTVKSLEAWHAVFDPSWFLMTLHNDEHIDSALEINPAPKQSQEDIDAVVAIRTVIQKGKNSAQIDGSIFRDQKFLSHEQKVLPQSNLAISTLSENGAKVIIDTTVYPEDIDKLRTVGHVRDLARILSCSQPWTLGLLQCIGVLRKLSSSDNISQFQMVFSMPPGPTDPASLRELLLRSSVSLDAKLVIAKAITRGVLAVHSADFVHKNIRPDTILVFSGPEERNIKAYLVGFERSRPAAAHTNLIGDMIWERNLYRHPSRQGIRPEDVYIMQHDIYSLGVCLLEIGIWNSLVLPSEPPKPGKLLQIGEQLGMKNSLKAAWDIKTILTDMAKTFLPSLMGLLYTNVVLSCLTCLDSDATNMFANEKDLYDEDGILVGVVFIEKILYRLESLSI